MLVCYNNSVEKKYLTGALFIIGLLIVGLISVQTQNPATTNSDKLKISASFYPLVFFAEEIGKDKVDVSNITPAGAEPHDYEPSGRDIANIMNSRLLILNGLGLEAWGNDVQKNIDQSQTSVITVGDTLVSRQIIENGVNSIDPHVWLSPVMAEQIVDSITRAMISADSKDEIVFISNASSLKMRLSELDQEYRAGLRNCTQKNIITSHAAFGYVGNNYGFGQQSIAGLSPDSEPSTRQMADITNYAKSNNVRYIFFESLVNPKLSQAVASETGAQILVLNPLEGLTPADIREQKDYFSEMRSNLTNLTLALECKR